MYVLRAQADQLVFIFTVIPRNRDLARWLRTEYSNFHPLFDWNANFDFVIPESLKEADLAMQRVP